MACEEAKALQKHKQKRKEPVRASTQKKHTGKGSSTFQRNRHGRDPRIFERSSQGKDPNALATKWEGGVEESRRAWVIGSVKTKEK